MWSARAHEAKKVNSSVKHSHKLRKNKRWSLMTPKCTPTLEIELVQDPGMFRALVRREKNVKLGLQDTIGKFLKFRWLKCPHIVHLNLISMSYDQKKCQESNSQIPLK
jgi:hypothetical protein